MKPPPDVIDLKVVRDRRKLDAEMAGVNNVLHVSPQDGFVVLVLNGKPLGAILPEDCRTFGQKFIRAAWRASLPAEKRRIAAEHPDPSPGQVWRTGDPEKRFVVLEVGVHVVKVRYVGSGAVRVYPATQFAVGGFRLLQAAPIK